MPPIPSFMFSFSFMLLDEFSNRQNVIDYRWIILQYTKIHVKTES